MSRDPTLYAFMHNEFVMAESAVVVSLHATRKGALRAMLRHSWNAWVDLRDGRARDSGMHMDRADRLADRREDDHGPLQNAASFVCAFEVQP